MADGAPVSADGSSLTVWIFDSPRGADEALPRLERSTGERVIVLDDAALVSWPYGCRKPSTRTLGAFGPGALRAASGACCSA